MSARAFAADSRWTQLPGVHFVAWGPGVVDGFWVGDDHLPLTEPVDLADGEWVTLRIAGDELVVAQRGSGDERPDGFDA